MISRIHSTHPGFLFIAEAYWGMESDLMEQGFDYCYDKELYDRLVGGDADNVRQHLLADIGYQNHLVRFIENHDEPRAASAFGPERAQAAAVAILTQTGARLVHDGQREGRRVRLPVFLGRYPDEPVDSELAGFYTSLLRSLTDETFRSGRWQLGERHGWPDNDSFRSLLAWSWEGATRWLVILNFSDRPASGLVTAPWPDVAGRSWRLVDPTHDTTFVRSGDDLVNGLFVDLGPWSWHLLRLDEDGTPEAP
jgi:hypothetical protein